MEPNLSAVKAFVLDVDGVMTDGSVLVDSNAEPLRIFNEKDGHGLRMAALNGYTLGVITGGHTEAVRKRMTAYGIPYENVYLLARDKRRILGEFCERFKLQPEEVLYFTSASMAAWGGIPSGAPIPRLMRGPSPLFALSALTASRSFCLREK